MTRERQAQTHSLTSRSVHRLYGGKRFEQRLQAASLDARTIIKHVEMEPGDVLFFHCNTLHRSDQNKSQNPRWSMICSYNAARNDPYKESQHPRYTPLVKVPDSQIREYGERRFSGDEASGVWLAEERDTTARNLRR